MNVGARPLREAAEKIHEQLRLQVTHSSRAQFASLPHVPMDAIQPGDLIFWGEGGGSHVALYVGGGTIIDASSSQNAVTQRGIWGSPVGAARIT